MSLATGCAQVPKSLFLPNLSWTHKVSLGQRSSPHPYPNLSQPLPNALPRNLGFSSFPQLDFPLPQIPKPQKFEKKYRSRV